VILYLVTDGDYSDRHVDSVFSTKEAAQKWIETLVPDGEIEEFELDPDIARFNIPPGMKPFRVCMDRNGDNAEARHLGACGEVPDPCEIYRKGKWEIHILKEYKKAGFTETIQTFMFARDEKHAIKIANERRTGLIASGEWGREVQKQKKEHEEWEKKRTPPLTSTVTYWDQSSGFQR
jgi:hypothetical protein